jgi:hypothetical protein
MAGELSPAPRIVAQDVADAYRDYRRPQHRSAPPARRTPASNRTRRQAADAVRALWIRVFGARGRRLRGQGTGIG